MRIQSAEVGRGSRVPLAVQCPVTAVAIARVEATATKGHRLWRNSATSFRRVSLREHYTAINTATRDDSIGKCANDFGVEVHRSDSFSANGMVTTSHDHLIQKFDAFHLIPKIVNAMTASSHKKPSRE